MLREFDNRFPVFLGRHCANRLMRPMPVFHVVEKGAVLPVDVALEFFVEVSRRHVEYRGYRRRGQLTLANRDAMGFRMLLGREAFRRRFLVDAGNSYYGGKPKRRVKKKKIKSIRMMMLLVRRKTQMVTTTCNSNTNRVR